MTILEGLSVARDGCQHHAMNLEEESKKRVSKWLTKSRKERLKKAADRFNEGASKLAVVINNWDDVRDD